MIGKKCECRRKEYLSGIYIYKCKNIFIKLQKESHYRVRVWVWFCVSGNTISVNERCVTESLTQPRMMALNFVWIFEL